MAYTQSTPTVKVTMEGGRQVVRISFTETETSSTSEWVVTDSRLPRMGTVVLYKADLTAGTGTTIQPKMGRATNPTVDTQNWIGQISAAAGAINDASPLRFANLAGVLYGRSTPNNAAADHSVSTEITIISGVI